MDLKEQNLEIKGRIVPHSCAELFAEISQAGFSGALRLSKEKEKVIAYFERGEIVFVVSNARKHRLFEILLKENVIAKEVLVKIDGFTHDLHLAEKLIEESVLAKPIIDSIFSIQIKQILNTVWSWDKGDWSFSPLTKIKEGIRFEINLHVLLGHFAKTLRNEQILGRFKSVSEAFSLSSASLDLASLNPSPTDAFLLSRIGEDTLTIDELRSASGLPNDQLYAALYQLWLEGVLKRSKWNSFFDDKAALKIAEAKLTLKRSATSYGEERELAEAEAKAEIENAKREAEEKEAAEKSAKAADKFIDLSLDSYLKRIEEAATHYEIFDLKYDASLGKIKKVYFTYAKNFHPDLFHKKVEDKKHQKIQNAFTEIAKAYDTLKDTDSRELYDFKLRKVIEAAKKNETPKMSAKDDFANHKNAGEASSQFETGYDLLMNGRYAQALPHLERAARFAEDNARYRAYFGRALSKDNKHRHRAESEIRTAINLDKNNTVYRMMLAEFYVEMGLAARAKGELNRLLKIKPNDTDALSLLDRISDT